NVFCVHPEDETRVFQTIRDWCPTATEAFRATPSERRVPNLHLGGVPEGLARHDELYFEARTGTELNSLHRRGTSFRVRLTTQEAGSDQYRTRVLIILTRYPVRDDRCGTITAENYWTYLDAARFPEFARLDPLRPTLARSTSLPSVVDC